MASREEGELGEAKEEFTKLLTSYLGLSFSIFLGLLPRNSVPLVSALQTQNKALSLKLVEAEEQLRQLHSRRKEDSKANARVVEIFASHRHAWQQVEKRLLQQIDECNEEIAYLKGKVEDIERVESDLKANNDELKREIYEKDEMLNFMSRGNCEVESSGGECCYNDLGLRYGKPGVSVSGGLDLVGVEDNFSDNGVPGVEEVRPLYSQSNSGFSADYLHAASKFWSEKASLCQDFQHESVESLYPLKLLVPRRELPWKVDGDSNGVSSKLNLLEQELQNLERIGKGDLCKIPAQLGKQTKRYQSLAAKLDDLCHRMQTSDPCDVSLSLEFRTQRQTEFLLEAFRLQQRASETGQKLMALQSERGGKSYYNGVEMGKAGMRRSLDSIRNNFKEIQRNLEIWLARIIGDLEGILARESASRTREYYVSRHPFGQ